jgi:DmsE family decaheme c-type cytochrome
MKALLRSFALCGFVVGLLGFAPAMAQQATKALDRDKVCTACHNESWPTPVLSIYQTKMGVRGDPRTPSCQDCHGPSENHLKSSENQVDIFYGAINPAASHSNTWPKAPSSVEARNGACLACHESRNLPRTNWAGSQHQTNGLACTNCHNVHSPDTKVLNKATQAEVCFGCHREQRADTRKISAHPLVTTAIGSAPKMVCSDCHDPHGSAGPKLLKKNTVNETCFTCHAEKRGPFLWEHQPATESCINCHNPHGSNITPLLKSRPPFLCDECHDGPHNSQSPFGTAVGGIQGGGVAPGGNPSTSAVGRACMNCHVMIHGSNSPAGAFLHR